MMRGVLRGIILERENYLLSVSKNDGILWRGILERQIILFEGNVLEKQGRFTWKGIERDGGRDFYQAIQ